MNTTQEINVILPNSLTFDEGHLVWKRDVAKGSLLLPQDGDIQRIVVEIARISHIPEVRLFKLKPSLLNLSSKVYKRGEGSKTVTYIVTD